MTPEMPLPMQKRYLYSAAQSYQTDLPFAIKTLEQIPGMQNEVFLREILRTFHLLQKEDDIESRRDGATILGERVAESGVTIRHPAVVSRFIDILLHDPDDSVRSGIAWSLGHMYNFEKEPNGARQVYPQVNVVNALRDALQRDKSNRVKSNITWALSKIKNTQP